MEKVIAAQTISKNYNPRFDLCAMILSFMVVMIHSSYAAFYTISESVSAFLDEYYTDYLSGFAVPMFFIISAMKFYRTYQPSMTGKKLKSRISTLLIPYLVWSLISVIWAITFSYVPFLSNAVSARETFSFSASNIIGGLFWFKYIHPFWYLAMLMIFSLLCPILYMIIKHKWLCIGVVIGLYFLDAMPIAFPNTSWPMFQIRTIIYSLAFYLLGAWIGKYYYNEVCKTPHKNMRWIGLLIYLIAVLLRGITSNSDVFFIPSILLGSYGIWLFCGTLNVKDNAIINTSFFIYPAHTFILPCVNKLLYFVLPDGDVFCLINTCLGTVITYCLCIVAACIVKKYFPRSISAMLNGSRK